MESIEETVNPYYAVRYPGYSRTEAHPARFGAVATWCGMQPAPIHHCRVLEIGCGDGAQILPMADMFPGSHFMGIDLAPGTIAVAREIAERAGLKNVTLEAMDLMEVGSSLGEFDYIIAHGFLSWVPQQVRDKLLSVCRELLAPQGCVYISYNTLPGCHWRLMLRVLLLFHTLGI